MNRLAAAVVIASLVCLPACASLRPGGSAQKQEKSDTGKDSGGKEEETEAEETKGLPLLGILFYIPNRFLDLFDVARAGVEVGPGFGVDGEATEALQAGVMARVSAGVGLQTLRHLPVKASGESYAALGPVAADPTAGLAWYRNKWDVRLEAHVAIFGAHAAINPAEIADFFLGFLTIDIMDDDL